MADTATKETPQTRATLKYLRTSAYKVREVLDLIRGLDVDDARHVLQFSERGPAREVLKVLNSAVANADNLLNIPADELKVAVAYADEGPTIKRWRPRARGRATRIRKRTCHITIIVARLSDAELQARRRRDSAAGTQRRRGVLPRRRRAAEPKAEKGKAAAPAAEEQLPEGPSGADVEPEAVAEAPAEAEAEVEEPTSEVEEPTTAVEEPAAEEPAAEEPAAEVEAPAEDEE
ncbi:MAG TPA: 50S ribosomal protein L22, partial [Acidimicrobiia bacterium]|nr:50S ribosomal protein L22 [Acidimicrobiia bacterium]